MTTPCLCVIGDTGTRRDGSDSGRGVVWAGQRRGEQRNLGEDGGGSLRLCGVVVAFARPPPRGDAIYRQSQPCSILSRSCSDEGLGGWNGGMAGRSGGCLHLAARLHLQLEAVVWWCLKPSSMLSPGREGHKPCGGHWRLTVGPRSSRRGQSGTGREGMGWDGEDGMGGEGDGWKGTDRPEFTVDGGCLEPMPSPPNPRFTVNPKKH